MYFKNKIINFLMLFIASGMCYLTIECFYRGWTVLASFFMGAIAGTIIGKLNHLPQYYKLKMWQECFIGMFLIVLLEFVVGYAALKYGIRYWDYSKCWLNYKGVICVPYAIIWYAITPFCMWCEDALKMKLFGEDKYYSILENYKELLTGK